MIKFSDCIDFVLENEGGYTNNPHDRGGCTNYGITLDDCLRYPRSGINTCEELKQMPLAMAKEIYKVFYWDARLSFLNERRVAIKLFDMLVNIGPFSIVLAQRAANACGARVKTDGVLGPLTTLAINTIETDIYLEELVQQLLSYYDRILDRDPSQVVFIHGWHNRARKLPT